MNLSRLEVVEYDVIGIPISIPFPWYIFRLRIEALRAGHGLIRLFVLTVLTFLLPS